MIEVRVDGLTAMNARELRKHSAVGWIVQATYATMVPRKAHESAQNDGRLAIVWAAGTVDGAMDLARGEFGGKSTEYASLIAVRNKLRAAEKDGHAKVRVTFLCDHCNAFFRAEPSEHWRTDLADAQAEYERHQAAHDVPGAAPKPVKTAPAAPSNVVELPTVRPAGPASIRNLRVPDHLWNAAKDVAAARSETVSAVLVAALRDYVDEHRGTAPVGRIAGEQELF